jgi:hypothetical protein
MPRSPGTLAYYAGTAQLFATAAAPQYLYGDAVQTRLCALGSLSAIISATASSSTLSITANWQVSQDGSTYYNVVPVNSATNVAMILGTGTSATTTNVIPATDVYGYKYARLRATSSGATANGTVDGVTVSYRYVKV